MPVTRLSKLFHERFGDEIADEVVNWFNSLETASHLNLREVNDLNFARFASKLDQRIAEQSARIDKLFAEHEARFNKQLVETEARINKQLVETETRINKRLTELEQRLAALEAKVDTRFAEIQLTVERSLKEQVRWMFFVWTSLLIPIIGLWIRS